MNNVRIGLLVQLQVAPERAAALEARLVATLPNIEEEEGTVAWLAVRLDEEPGRYLIVDAFPDEAARQAHLDAGRPRLARTVELLAAAPSVSRTTVVAAKLPGTDTRAENNKRTVLAFYEAALRRGDRDAARTLSNDKPSWRTLLAERYIQHDPLIADGVDGFEAFLEGLGRQFPDLDFDIERVVAEGDHVVVHLHGRREPAETGAAIVDIFRLEHGRIAEHWCVRQPVPEASRNDNGMF